MTPLHLVVCSLAHEAMLALLRHGAPVWALRDDGGNRKCDPPLRRAAREGGVEGAAEAVELLVRWGADVSQLNSNGKIAFTWLAKSFREKQSTRRT